MDSRYSATYLFSGGTLGEPDRSSRQRIAALSIVTLAFWGMNFGVATLANVLGHSPNLALTLVMRLGLYLFGLVLCFVLYRVQEAQDQSLSSRVRALALFAPLAAGMCACGSLAIAQYVDAETATLPEVVKTVARWLWFFVGWSAASLAVRYYFDWRDGTRSTAEQASAANVHATPLVESSGRHSNAEDYAEDRDYAEGAGSSTSLAESAKGLNLWIGFEVTTDISRESRIAAHDFGEAFNAALRARPWRSSLTNVDVLLVIMNPEIAPPLTESVILSRQPDRVDCRVRLDFRRWIESNRGTRVRLIRDGVSNALAKIPADLVGPVEREILHFALESAATVTSRM